MEVSTDGGASWIDAGNRVQDYGEGWSLQSIDLTAYAGQRIRISFHHVSDRAHTGSGWYIDNVERVRLEPDFGDGTFEGGWGDWYADRGLWQIGEPSSGPSG